MPKSRCVPGTRLASRADWRRPAEVKAAYRNASVVANNRIVFNVKGNDYRLIAALHYNRGMMFIRFVGTHREHYPIEAPDPIDFLQHVMEARAMTRKDLEPFIGSRARVAEVLNRVRPLTLNMIRRLASGLKLPADVLIRGYELKRAA